MPLITYIDHQGNKTEVDVPAGDTLMNGAVDNGVEGIVADCGGACVCSTCHCYVDEAWLEKTGRPGEDEGLLLEMTSEVKENSRLSCQIVITDELDRLVVR